VIMMTIPKTRLLDLITNFKNQKILVIGDHMLDDYWIGTVDRISPEAPVPIVAARERKFVPGGAANVAHNLNALKGTVISFGVAGKDEEGAILKRLLTQEGLSCHLIAEEGRPTTHKVRVIAHNQQTVRVDWEKKHLIHPETVNQILSLLQEHIKDAKVLIISDYGKGVFNQSFVQQLVTLARQHHVITLVDPIPKHALFYNGCDLVTPNHKEAVVMAKKEDHEQTEDVNIIGEHLKQTLGANILITRGEKGMALYEQNKEPQHITTKAVEVFDVSGAGDTVVASLGLALAAGATLQEASHLANYAAGVVVGKSGTSTVNQEELMKAVLADNA